MTTKIFQHPAYIRWFALTFNILGFLSPIYFVVSFAIKASQTDIPVSPLVWLVVVFRALLIGIFLIITANYFCEITADENGLWVSFLWLQLHIQWQNIIEIKPTILNSKSWTSWVVLTNTLTPFHRLYGLIYGLSSLPGFIITPAISNKEELVLLIIEHTKP